MGRKPFRLLLSAALGAFAFIAVSQSPAASQQDHQMPMPRTSGSTMPMHDMMGECMKHCQATAASIDQTLKQIEAAKKSNDPARLRAALSQSEQSLRGMREHMGMCMQMMTMHGGMSGGSQGGRMPGHAGMMGGNQPDESGMVTCTMGMKVDPKTAPRATYKGRTYYFCSEREKKQFEQNPEKFLRGR